jgi:hypothetical protein
LRGQKGYAQVTGSVLLKIQLCIEVLESTILGSESSIAPETIQAYRETDYRVFSDIPVTLRIAERNEALLGLYKTNRCDSGAFVTACNPLGQQFSEAENTRLQDQLEHELGFRSLNFIAGEGKHPVGDWPGEPSFLVFGLSLEAAKTLGRKLEQNAIVWCGNDAVPQLVLLR